MEMYVPLEIWQLFCDKLGIKSDIKFSVKKRKNSTELPAQPPLKKLKIDFLIFI